MEAVEWAKRCPPLGTSPTEIELRPRYDFEDFEGVVTPEVAEQEREFRAPISDY